MGWETSVACLGLLACACGPSIYVQPDQPTNQLALVVVERRAQIESVDGHPLVVEDRKSPERFWISEGCHDLIAKYEESYVYGTGEYKYSIFLLVIFGVVVATLETVPVVATTTLRKYETDMPIRFHIPAKPGVKYWLTSSFDGDKFMPRVAVLNEADERVAVILPEQPCPSGSTPAAAP